MSDESPQRSAWSTARSPTAGGSRPTWTSTTWWLPKRWCEGGYGTPPQEQLSSLRTQGPITTGRSRWHERRMYYVYILASRRHGTLYIGVTNSLQKRLEEHRNGQGSSFVKQYGVFRLVYVEAYE